MTTRTDARLEAVLTAARAVAAMAGRPHTGRELNSAVKSLAAALDAYDGLPHQESNIPDMVSYLRPPAERVAERSWGKAYWSETLGWVSIPDGD